MGNKNSFSAGSHGKMGKKVEKMVKKLGEKKAKSVVKPKKKVVKLKKEVKKPPSIESKRQIALQHMRRIPIKKQPLQGVLTQALPASKEELEIALAIADEVSHALAVAAANPQESFAKGSFASHFQKKFAKFNAQERGSARNRAQSLLSRPLSERKLYFGGYAEKGIDAHKQPHSGLDPKLQPKIKKAVQKRFSLYPKELEDFSRKVVSSRFLASFPSTKTEILEIGRFIGTDVPLSFGLDAEIHEPGEYVDVKWKTEESKARRGIWRVLELPSCKVVASGEAGDAPEGVFRVDFAKFAPPTPPDEPLVYLIKVYPYPAKPKLGFHPIPLQKPVGYGSNSARIRYVKGGVQAIFEMVEIFREIELYIENITMIEEQTGPGWEEFHITGFVQQDSEAVEDLRQVKHRYVEIDPDGERTISFRPKAIETTFSLQDPGSYAPKKHYGEWEKRYYWPKAFTLTLSVLEEDDGDAVADWLSEIWKHAKEELSVVISGLFEEAIEDLVKEFTDIFLKEILEDLGLLEDVISEITKLICIPIVSAILSAVGIIVAEIIKGLQDDYYGTQTYVLALPSNLTDYIYSLPGAQIEKWETGKDGYKLKSKSMRFVEGGGDYEPVDFGDYFLGRVGISVCWYLKKKENVATGLKFVPISKP